MAQELTYRERRQLIKKAIYLVLAIAFITIIAGALFGDAGLLVNLRVKVEYDRLVEERDRLRAETERLAQEIRSLQNDDRRIEALGRKEFGFGRPGEIIFYFPEDAERPIESYENEVPPSPAP